ncbi:MAG TPA: transposase [Lachnospiraceae bacterium]|nr:transposase [Lachnospiraceae bacterium]
MFHYIHHRRIAKYYFPSNRRPRLHDCTNYFFEIEQEDGLKQYGPSKEHRPNPIVEMGLFMDGDRIPLAFSIHAGNTNEQLTLKPLEEQIIKDFSMSKFIVCTDAGLSSTNNRKFNNVNERSFITTQSIKKLKKHLKEWALSSEGWLLERIAEKYDISQLEKSEESIEKYRNCTFYKERWINEDAIIYESIYDGFYAVCTNLEDEAPAIAKINHNRWEIEECFRIMKTDFKARPVYLSRDDRIKAHFTTCFLALVIHRYLEKRLDNKYTSSNIINTLRNMNFFKVQTEEYIPTYTRTDLTDTLHETFDFRTDYQIISTTQMKKIFKSTKK